MNGYNTGSASGLTGANLGRLADAQTPIPAVHAAQEALEKATAMLWGEINDLRGQLGPVLSPEPANTAGVKEAAPTPNYVAARINASAESVAAAAGALRALRSRLEV